MDLDKAGFFILGPNTAEDSAIVRDLLAENEEALQAFHNIEVRGEERLNRAVGNAVTDQLVEKYGDDAKVVNVRSLWEAAVEERRARLAS